MSVALKGLRLKPTYEQLTGAAVPDGLEHIRFPNRNASFLRWLCSITIRWRRYEGYGKTARNGK